MSRRVEEFVPIQPDKVSLYCCGPTVYNYAHIGNLRAYHFEDILRRTLEYKGYAVRHVMNITDVGHLSDDGDEGEDKIIVSAREKGLSVHEIADFFTRAFFEDIDALQIRRPEVICKATEHISHIISFIHRLEEKGFTYEAGGNIYFNTALSPDYGALANLKNQSLRHGSRVAVDTNKKNAQDFVLWFTESKFTNQAMLWDSPWGEGYPGWHIECSAMSSHYLGPRFDIHCGGVDHIPVHHSNEIAQSEALYGAPWVRRWMHNEFLLTKNQKMSKSRGRIMTLSDLREEGFDPLDYRYFLLGGHYRKQLHFSLESLRGARAARLKLTERLRELRAETGDRAEESPLSDHAKTVFRNTFREIFNDLGTPRFLSSLWLLLKDSRLSAGEKCRIVSEADRIAGLRLTELSAASGGSPASEEAGSESSLSDEDIQTWADKRETARREKNYKEADRIRDFLQSRGILLKDGASGSVWTRKG